LAQQASGEAKSSISFGHCAKWNFERQQELPSWPKFLSRVVDLAKCASGRVILAKFTLASEGQQDPINEKYHLIDADPINESYRSGLFSLYRLGKIDIF
jgi:hypothetical protein